MPELGTETRPLRVAVIGSGPSGFYATEALFKADLVCNVDMFERLPTPFGLVRSGVAPDHPKIRQVTKVYERIAEHPRFHYFGNVEIGIRITVNELRRFYDAIIFACGTETNQRLDIPGEELPGCHTATSFVGWYNGHPGFRHLDFDLSCETAVIIGIGNVAMDVARMLAKSVDELKRTDISQNALDCLAESKIKEIHIIARRGPAQAKCSPAELKEMGALADCDCIADPEDLRLNPESETEREEPAIEKTMSLFDAYANNPGHGRRRKIRFRFLLSPVRVMGTEQVEAIALERNRLKGAPFEQWAKGTGEVVEQSCGLLFSSIGYRGMPLPGVPYDRRRGTIPNLDGRILDEGEPIPGLYAVGWIRRGPQGLIGTNRADSFSTVQKILEDLPGLEACPTPDTEAVRQFLEGRGERIVGFGDWRRINAAEIERGQTVGKPRERFTRISHMLAVLERQETPSKTPEETTETGA